MQGLKLPAHTTPRKQHDLSYPRPPSTRFNRADHRCRSLRRFVKRRKNRALLRFRPHRRQPAYRPFVAGVGFAPFPTGRPHAGCAGGRGNRHDRRPELQSRRAQPEHGGNGGGLGGKNPRPVAAVFKF